MSTTQQSDRDRLAEAVRHLERAHLTLSLLVDDRRRAAEDEVGSSDVFRLLDAAYEQSAAGQPGAACRWRAALGVSGATVDAMRAVVNFASGEG